MSFFLDLKMFADMTKMIPIEYIGPIRYPVASMSAGTLKLSIESVNKRVVSMIPGTVNDDIGLALFMVGVYVASRMARNVSERLKKWDNPLIWLPCYVTSAAFSVVSMLSEAATLCTIFSLGATLGCTVANTRVINVSQ